MVKTIKDRYNCQKCGCCCLQVGIAPFSEEELLNLPKPLMHVVAFFMKYDPDRPFGSPCYFYNFKTGKCAIYEQRPESCRTYEPAGDKCKKVRATRFALRWSLQLTLSEVDSIDDLKTVNQLIKNGKSKDECLSPTSDGSI